MLCFFPGLKIFDDQDFGEKVGDDTDLFLLPRKQPETASAPETTTADDELLRYAFVAFFILYVRC